ncbi:MAG: hypothetical protein RLZZ111_1127 [Planctomycetota bacterium]|jgi:hypothetical protein
MHFFDPDQTQSLPVHVARSSSSADAGPPSATAWQAMQADHTAWQATLARWRDDASRWKSEHDTMLARLAEMRRAVVEHGQSLIAHESAYREIDQSLEDFGMLLAALPTTMPPGAAEPAAVRHCDLAATMRRVEDTHTRMRKHHEAVVARMADLERAASAPL